MARRPKLDKVPTITEYEAIVRRLRSRAQRRPVIEHVFPLFVAVTGCRVSECLEVSTMDIDFDEPAVFIPTLKKGGGGKRLVPLPHWMVPILKRYIVANGIGDKLFPISRHQAYRLVKKATGYHPHAFRHAFAMYMLWSGRDPETVRRLLGHSSWDMVRYYVEAVKGVERGLAHPLDEL